MYSHTGDRFTKEPFIVDFSVMIIWPEHASDEMHLLPNNNNSKDVEQLLKCTQQAPEQLE